MAFLLSGACSQVFNWLFWLNCSLWKFWYLTSSPHLMNMLGFELDIKCTIWKLYYQQLFMNQISTDCPNNMMESQNKTSSYLSYTKLPDLHIRCFLIVFWFLINFNFSWWIFISIFQICSHKYLVLVYGHCGTDPGLATHFTAGTTTHSTN